MPQYRTFASASTLLSYLLALTIGFCLCLPVHAQEFRPIPAEGTCNVFVEGRGHYIFGGVGPNDNHLQISQSFMIDLSVSWNSSDPVFKKLPDSPGPYIAACALLPNREDVFLAVNSVGYIFNINSNSWTLFRTAKFSIEFGSFAASDLETGFVYIPWGAFDATGRQGLAVVNTGTRHVSFQRIMVQR
jgi:hypothetical protein